MGNKSQRGKRGTKKAAENRQTKRREREKKREKENKRENETKERERDKRRSIRRTIGGDNNAQHGASGETMHRGWSAPRRESLNQRSAYNKTAARWLEGL